MKGTITDFCGTPDVTGTCIKEISNFLHKIFVKIEFCLLNLFETRIQLKKMRHKLRAYTIQCTMIHRALVYRWSYIYEIVQSDQCRSGRRTRWNQNWFSRIMSWNNWPDWLKNKCSRIFTRVGIRLIDRKSSMVGDEHLGMGATTAHFQMQGTVPDINDLFNKSGIMVQRWCEQQPFKASSKIWWGLSWVWSTQIIVHQEAGASKQAFLSWSLKTKLLMHAGYKTKENFRTEHS